MLNSSSRQIAERAQDAMRHESRCLFRVSWKSDILGRCSTAAASTFDPKQRRHRHVAGSLARMARVPPWKDTLAINFLLDTLVQLTYVLKSRNCSAGALCLVTINNTSVGTFFRGGYFSRIESKEPRRLRLVRNWLYTSAPLRAQCRMMPLQFQY